jgi:hypothetical protein
MSDERMHTIARNEFHTMADFYDRLFSGWYALILWETASPNAIWVTGPYDSPERARADADYFKQNDQYPKVQSYRVAGNYIPPVTVAKAPASATVIDDARIDEVSLTPDGIEVGATILRTHEEGRDDEQR